MYKQMDREYVRWIQEQILHQKTVQSSEYKLNSFSKDTANCIYLAIQSIIGFTEILIIFSLSLRPAYVPLSTFFHSSTPILHLLSSDELCPLSMVGFQKQKSIGLRISISSFLPPSA